jgi:hypothetical protein
MEQLGNFFSYFVNSTALWVGMRDYMVPGLIKTLYFCQLVPWQWPTENWASDPANSAQ